MPPYRTARHPAAALVVAAALAGLLTGCSGSNAAPPSPAPTTTSAVPSASPGTAPVNSPAPVVVPTPDPSGSFTPFTGPAADEFGADNVMAAYKFATSFMLKSTFDGTLITLAQPRQVDFTAVEAGLTPAARALFRELTAKLESTTVNLTPEENAALVSLASYGAATAFPGYTMRSPSYRNAGFGAARAEVFKAAGRPDSLVLRFPVTGTFLLADAAGKPVIVDYKKDMVLTLVQTGDPAQPWLVDGWRGTRTVDGPKPDPSS